MGLGWRALLDLGPPIGRCGAQRGQPAPKLRSRRRGGGIDGDRAPDAGGRGLESEERVLGLDPDGLRGHGRGHRFVAVAVAADPAAETQERGRKRRAHTGVGGTQRPVQRAIDLWHHTKEGFVEDGHDRAHLIERGHL